jgi:chemotaxis protein methyltransferase CheR
MFMQLLQYLTIPVSEMFRDPGTSWRCARKWCRCCAPIRRSRSGSPAAARARRCIPWPSCCARRGLLERTIIYATDINPHSLDKAKQGIYSMQSMREYTANYRRPAAARLAEYYTAAYGNAIFDSSLRENVTFADHSLATDSVFSETQLVSCRNVLIYFNKDLQDRALGLFHESLCHRGFLVLGSKESVDFSAYSDVSSRWSSLNGSTVMNGVRAVVIGASAGGVTALFTVLGALPAGFAIPVLCVLHLPDDRHSQLAEVLQRRLQRPVCEAATRPSRRADLWPGRATTCRWSGRSLSLSQEAGHFSRPAIDYLFASAADAYGDGPAGVLLTGANEDGAQGLPTSRTAGPDRRPGPS